ncbi:hypothetical protein [Microbacterium sp. MTN4-26]|uniref:hypothetical protein n=1 Tax=unclassified Microbacterium TaxID=2609290 RepID=UPI0036F23F6D
MRRFSRLGVSATIAAAMLLITAAPAAASTTSAITLTAAPARTATATATATPVSITFTPNTLTAVRGETVTTALSIDNGSDQPMTQLRVGKISRDDVTVAFTTQPQAVGDNASATIPAGGSLLLLAEVTVVAQLPGPTTLVADVTYRLGDTLRQEAATLTVTPATWPTAAPGPLAVTAQGPTSLVDTRATDLIFLITNSSTAEQTIESAVITYPSFLTVSVSGEGATGEPGRLRLTDPIVVAPGGGVTLLVNVEADDGVRPGTALIVLDLGYSQLDSSTAGFASASHSLTVSVFGESDVTTVFTAALAPAFWIVPGVLFVLVVWVLYTRVSPKNRFDLTSGSGLAATAALGIVSLFPAFLFPVVYNALFDRQFPDVYGFSDVVGLMVFALAAGVAVWLLLVLAHQLIRSFRFEPGDSPARLLWKMRWRPRQLNIPSATVRAEDGAEQTAIVLRSGFDMALVAPVMQVSGGNPDDLDAAITARSARALYRALRRGRPENTIAFVPGGASVREVKTSALSNHGTISPVRLT